MEFEGVYPAIITPLDETNKLKEEESFVTQEADQFFSDLPQMNLV